MISFLRGTLQRVAQGEVIVEVGGVGLRLRVPTSVLEQAPEVGQMIFLHTRLVVREDALALYGFASQEERQLFDMLGQVNGVGPRLALAVLSNLSTELLRAAVANGQVDILTRVPGVGRKTAEKIIFHLKDRLAAAPVTTLTPPSESDAEVLQALTALGYGLTEAHAALQSIPSDTSQDVEERVRMALKYFARP